MAEEMRRPVEFGDGAAPGEQGDDSPGGGAGLRAIPEAGDDRAHKRGQVGPKGPERRPGKNRIGNSGLDAGKPHESHQKEDDQRSDADRKDEIDEIAADQKETRGEIIAPETMDVRRPDVEDAEGPP